MAIGEPEAIDDAPIRAGTSVEDDDGQTFLPREECRPGRQGKKSLPVVVAALGDRSAAVLRSDQAKERSCGPRAEQDPRKKTWLTLKVPRKGPGDPGEERGRGVEKGWRPVPTIRIDNDVATQYRVSHAGDGG
jgi:hypothetical protein